MFKIGNKNKWDKQELMMYKTHSGGDKKGGNKETVLTAAAGGAILRFSEAEWHDEEPTVEEYLVDAKALEEIKEVFMKYEMYKWEDKKFSDLFVADGKTTSYLFSFTEDDISFSSQLYPDPYAAMLDELDAVIEKYRSTGKKTK